MASSFCPSPSSRSISLQNSPGGASPTELVHRSHSPHPPFIGHSAMGSTDSENGFVKQAVYGDVHPIPVQPQPIVTPKVDDQPKLFGLPLKYVSLVTLAVQNATLTIIMHYSRVSTAPSETYSAASAVLLNELLKGSISMLIALLRLAPEDRHTRSALDDSGSYSLLSSVSPRSATNLLHKFRRLGREVFSADCWKLSIPAILYVIQNNLQFVAATNLDVATFQVTYQMKILTTAAFSVLLLRARLSTTKWLSLLALAVGVGIVQIQTTSTSSSPSHNSHADNMNPLKGFLAVAAACMTSGLAGVYFEMVLKGSKSDLWVRNVQLSLFSLLPALVPILFSGETDGGWFPWGLFRNFGLWAWATVLVQVFGGLVTAVVIKYSDNIMKGFATSLSIVISFLASVALFDFSITVPFVVGSCVVLGATLAYNQPAPTPKPVKQDGVIAPPPKKSPGTEMGYMSSGQGVNGAPLYRTPTNSAPPSRSHSTAGLNLSMTSDGTGDGKLGIPRR